MRTRHLVLCVLCVASSCASTALALTDPTRPSGFVAAPEGVQAEKNLRLESVLISAERRVAVINGKACRIGERVDGATLIAIHADGAVVMREGKRVALPLLKVRVRSHAR